jgi:hypothetical protein
MKERIDQLILPQSAQLLLAESPFVQESPKQRTGSTTQIYLDSGTSRDLVVCAESTDTVLNQGTNNVVIGCQQLDPAAKSVSPAASKPRHGLPKGKPWLRQP